MFVSSVTPPREKDGAGEVLGKLVHSSLQLGVVGDESGLGDGQVELSRELREGTLVVQAS